MGFCVRQIETTSQRVAKLMVQGHPDLSQNRPAEPRSELGVLARLKITWIRYHTRQALA